MQRVSEGSALRVVAAALSRALSRIALLALILLLSAPALSALAVREKAEADAVATDASAREQRLVVYVREGCPHCAKAKAYLEGLSREMPRLRVVYRQVDADDAALVDLARHSRAAGVWPPGVPTFVHEGSVLVGFESAERTAPALLALLGREAAPVGEVRSNLFGAVSVAELGLPLFALVLGLLDGFNPCATWVLLFLLSLLVRVRSRARMALVAGTFVAASAAVYYAFMAAWLNLFLAIGLSAALRIALGAIALAIGTVNVKDFFAWRRGPSLSIPDAARPGLYARMRAVLDARALPASLVAVAGLAVVVNFVELLCTAGFPAVFTAVLAQQGLSAAARYAYLALYIAGYVADDSLMVTVAVITLGSHRLTERGGRWLKLVSGAVMLVLGMLLLLRPDLLW